MIIPNKALFKRMAELHNVIMDSYDENVIPCEEITKEYLELQEKATNALLPLFELIIETGSLTATLFNKNRTKFITFDIDSIAANQNFQLYGNKISSTSMESFLWTPFKRMFSKKELALIEIAVRLRAESSEDNSEDNESKKWSDLLARVEKESKNV